MRSAWADFYRDRVDNPKYEAYFQDKYHDYLLSVSCLAPYPTKVELGCGTALTTKLMEYKGVFGIDSSVEMLRFAKINSPTIIPIKMNILKFRPYAPMAIYSHGVLEHFSDLEIRCLIAKCKRAKCKMVHYVPTDKYLIPSFGDERLMSKAKWLKLTRPTGYIESNSKQDLTLIF